MTVLYDELCRGGVLICMNVKPPPAKDAQEMHNNEIKLKILISQIDENLAKSIIDMFTSRYEVGTMNQTTCYVRFAYFMGLQVENCAQMICRTYIDTHRFHAEVSYEGRNSSNMTRK